MYSSAGLRPISYKPDRAGHFGFRGELDWLMDIR